MRSWLRKGLAWLVLALTMLSLPGPASKACACARVSSEAARSSSAQMTRQECMRCAMASSAASRGVKQLTRPTCCRSKVTDTHAAATPARVQLERPDNHIALPAAVAPSHTVNSERPRSTRAPPRRGLRDSAAPPASYLSDYLRL